MSQKALVYILINNWNGRNYTLACLEALYRIDHERFVVILVDNASTDGTPGSVVEWAQRVNVPVTRLAHTKDVSHSEFAARHLQPTRPERSVLLIECDASIGFTGANNLSIEFALREGADYALFLNNDTEVTPDFLSRMLHSAETHPAAVWGCKITYHDRPELVWFAGGHVTLWGIPASDGDGKPESRFSGVKRTELVSGCVMLLPRAVLNQVGGQDERYFFAIDDIEYSVRLAKAGTPLMVDLDAVVLHKVSRSVVKKRPLQLYYLTRNTLMWRFEHYNGVHNGLFLVRWLPRWFAELVARVLWRQPLVSRGMWQGMRDFFRGVEGECPHQWLNPDYRAAR